MMLQDAVTSDPPADAAAATPTGNLDLTAEIERLKSINSEQLLAWGEQYLLPALIALIAILVGYFVAKFLSRLVSGPVVKRVDETLGKFVGKFVFYAILAGITIGVLSKIGAPVGGLAALVAATGFAVGLAFQGTLSNFASGVLLLVFRPFKVGDFVDAGGVRGKVNEIDLFTVTLDTPDNRRIIVPNSAISAGTIENITHHRHRRVDVEVGVEYSADLDKTRQVLTEAAEAMRAQMVDGPDRGYAVVLTGLGASSVDWVIRFWTERGDYWDVKEALTGEVKRRLDHAGIGIPFPQMDVHLDGLSLTATAPAPLGSQAPPRTRPRPRQSTEVSAP